MSSTMPATLSSYMAKKRLLWKQLSPSSSSKDPFERQHQKSQQQQSIHTIVGHNNDDNNMPPSDGDEQSGEDLVMDDSVSSNNGNRPPPPASDSKEQTEIPITTLNDGASDMVMSPPLVSPYGIRPVGAWRSRLPRKAMSPSTILPALVSPPTSHVNTHSTQHHHHHDHLPSANGSIENRQLQSDIIPNSITNVPTNYHSVSTVTPTTSSSMRSLSLSSPNPSHRSVRLRSSPRVTITSSSSTPSLLNKPSSSSLPINTTSTSSLSSLNAMLESIAATDSPISSGNTISSPSPNNIDAAQSTRHHHHNRASGGTNGIVLPSITQPLIASPVPLARPTTPSIGRLTPAAAAASSNASANVPQSQPQEDSTVGVAANRSALRPAKLMMFSANVNVDAAHIAAAERHRVSSPTQSPPATAGSATNDTNNTSSSSSVSTQATPSIQWFNDRNGVIGDDELFKMEQVERKMKASTDAIIQASASPPNPRSSPLPRSPSSEKNSSLGNDEKERLRSSHVNNNNNDTSNTNVSPPIVPTTPIPPSTSSQLRHSSNRELSPIRGSTGSRNIVSSPPISSTRLNSPTRTATNSILSSLLSRSGTSYRARSPDRSNPNNNTAAPQQPVIPLSPFQLGTPLTLAPTPVTPPINDDEFTQRPTALEELRITRKENLPHSLLELLYRPQYQPHWLPVSFPPTILARLPPDQSLQAQLEMEQLRAEAQAKFGGSDIGDNTNDDDNNNNVEQSSIINTLPTRDSVNRSILRSQSTSSLDPSSSSFSILTRTYSDEHTQTHYRPDNGDRIVLAAGRPRLHSTTLPPADRHYHAARAAAEAKVIAHLKQHETELRRKRSDRSLLPRHNVASANKVNKSQPVAATPIPPSSEPSAVVPSSSDTSA